MSVSAFPGLQRFSQFARWLWLGLLILPAATSASAWHAWDVAPLQLLTVSCWWLLVLRLLLPGASFVFATYPLVLAGLACLTADLMRNVDLLELAAQWRTFETEDVLSLLKPYALATALAALGLAAWAWFCERPALMDDRPSPRLALRPAQRAAVLLIGTGLIAAWVPAVAWTRAWPASAVLIGASAVAQQPAWASLAITGAGIDPQRPNDNWGAIRDTANTVAPAATAASPSTTQETYVLVIGESVRADALRECGAPAPMRSVAHGAVVACDVSSGSNATHTSVPLLISRDVPGHRSRIPADATFLRAFESLNFQTHWIATQSRDVAWPDAQLQHYSTDGDAQVLLPALDKALQQHPGRMALVLHMTGAHEPYCSRFDRSQAPFGDACKTLGDAPHAGNLADWRAMYGNAVDASVDVLNQIIQRLTHTPGRVFLIFTPDHGENLMDDQRGLHGHALRTPTRWDTQVPAVFWSNESWRAAHPQGWAKLQQNLGRPLMHADIVPTLLQAAQIRYEDKRSQPLGLLRMDVGQRQRLVQAAVGSTRDFAELPGTAAAATPASPVAVR